MSDSIRASKQGISQVNQSRIQKGWLKYQEDWYKSAKVSISTLKRFLSREPISPKNFAALCKAVGIESWEEIIDWNEKENPESNDANYSAENIIKGRYKINKPLESRNCEIYLAQDLDYPYEPECVVKKLPSTKMSERDKRLFEREVDALYKLGKNDHIPSLLASFEENHELYLVEEYIDGQALSEELIEDESWNEEKIIDFLEEVLETLQVIHESGYIHRNINPDNLIRRECDHKLVFIGFRGTKAIFKESTSQKITSRTRTTSKHDRSCAAYVSSEQMFGIPKFCSDIYSIGIIAIQARTGVDPGELRNNDETSDVVWRNLVKNNLNLEIDNILDKMVRFNYKNRYQSVQELLQDLNKIA